MKTKCKCGICGHEITGNNKWRVEHEMWEEHIQKEHPAKFAEYEAKRKIIEEIIDDLRSQIPSLYTTEWKGRIREGSWTI